MTAYSTIQRLAVVAAFLCVASAAASAEPIRITSGRIHWDDHGGDGVTSAFFLGRMFEASFQALPWSFGLINGRLDVSGTFEDVFDPGSFVSGEFRLNGQNFSLRQSRLTIAAPRVPLNDFEQTPEPSGTPFQLTGTLVGIDPQTNEFARVDLVGQGQVRAWSAESNFAEFVFSPDPAPIPEPGTVLLLGVAVASCVARFRNRPH